MNTEFPVSEKSYTCPCCGISMIETAAMEVERLSEIERLRAAVEWLAWGMKQIQTRPAEASAFLACTYLAEAKRAYGVVPKEGASND